MGKWQVGQQVTANEGTILVEGDPNDPDGLTVEAGAFGIIVALHRIVTGYDGRFAWAVTVRFPRTCDGGYAVEYIRTDTDALTRQPGALGFVTLAEEMDAQVSDAEAVARAKVAHREVMFKQYGASSLGPHF